MAKSTSQTLPQGSLNRDDFMRTLIRELSGTLQVGLDEAFGFISVVGLQMANQIDKWCRVAESADGRMYFRTKHDD